jgi:hypothetical protein
MLEAWLWSALPGWRLTSLNNEATEMKAAAYGKENKRRIE